MPPPSFLTRLLAGDTAYSSMLNDVPVPIMKTCPQCQLHNAERGLLGCFLIVD